MSMKQLTFEEWKKKHFSEDLEIIEEEICPYCNKGEAKCEKCDGDGECSECGRECDECDGTGKVKCEECGGEGDPAFRLYEEIQRRERKLIEQFEKNGAVV